MTESMTTAPSQQDTQKQFQQFAALPPLAQSAFLQQMIDQNLRTDPVRLKAALQTTIEQQTALEKLAAVEQSAHIDVKQALERGETITQVMQKAKGTDAVTQAAVASTAQEYTQEKQQETAKKADDAHRAARGENHDPMAAAMANHGDFAASFKVLLGGHAQDHAQEASSPAGTKVAGLAPDKNTGRTA